MAKMNPVFAAKDQMYRAAESCGHDWADVCFDDDEGEAPSFRDAPVVIDEHSGIDLTEANDTTKAILAAMAFRSAAMRYADLVIERELADAVLEARGCG
jgi:hypothetical protein